MRAAIYARYSTDKQRESSIEDQAEHCKRRAVSEGFNVIATIGDDGISGSTPVARRLGGARLLADALADRFDVLVVEGLDRLSRDQVEQESIVRRLEHRGIVIVGVSDGYDSRMGGRKIMRGVRGLINELYLDDLRQKTHRGQSGQVDRGFVAGGKSYGYRIVKEESGSRYEIDEKQAKWVRFVFEKYVEGWSSRAIAHELNRLGVASPRDSTWAVSGIYGSPAKGSGILNNELYVGRYVWNRSQWVKDPDTGARQRIDRPKEEWRISEAPELRIVDPEVWALARQRMDGPRQRGGRGLGRKSMTLFGGLMRCPFCDGAVIAVNGTQYGCAAHKDRGSTVCRGIYFSRDLAEKRLLGEIRETLLSPQAREEFQIAIKAIDSDRKRNNVDTAAGARTRLAELESEIKRMVDAIVAIGVSDAIQSRLKAAEQERAGLLATKTATKPGVTAADVGARVDRILLNLKNALENDSQQARKLIAEFFGEIQIMVDDENIYAEYNDAAESLLLAANGAFRNMVAGARNLESKRRLTLAPRRLQNS